MLLRITEKLMKLFYAELEILDDNNSSNIKELPDQNQFFESLQYIGVEKPYYIENNSYKLKSFTGEDCLNILERLDFEFFFPQDNYPLFVKKD
jgi:hypothetical protein